MANLTEGKVRALGGNFLKEGIPGDLDDGRAQEWVEAMGRLMPRVLRFGPAAIERALKALWPFRDQRPFVRGWTIEREGRKASAPIDASKLEAVPFHKNGENFVRGEEMLCRASDAQSFSGCAEFSMHDAEDILEQADKVPQELRGKVLVFADTILVDGNGDRRFAYLVWLGGLWHLGWFCLDDGFNRDCQFVRLRPPAAQP